MFVYSFSQFFHDKDTFAKEALKIVYNITDFQVFLC